MSNMIILFSALTVHFSHADGRYCVAPWGSIVQDGLTIVAYEDDRPPKGERCRSEIRRCHDGVLTGFYRYRNCYATY